MSILCFFFFKQKTAYEMRISDWSSDVCSSDLLAKGIPSISFNLRHGGAANIDRKDPKQSIAEILKLANNMKTKNWSAFIFPEGKIGRASCRERVCQYV